MLLRILALLLCLAGALISAHAETFNDWVHAAPAGNVTYNPWQPSSDDQGIHGYLDLSKLPPSAFPIRVRVLYSGDFDREQWSSGFHQASQPPTADSQMTPTRVTVETAFASPDKAAALPIWISPIPMYDLMPSFGTIYETVRAEVVSNDGTRLSRLFVGAFQGNTFYGQTRAFSLNSPEAASAFGSANMGNTNITRLVPDAFAYHDTKALWIDASAITDTTLTDQFWRRLLLQGTIISGHPEDIQALTSRLALTKDAPQLLGSFLASSDPKTLIPDFQAAAQVDPYGGAGISPGFNPYSSEERPAQTMHRQLINFSRWYLGLFFVCEVIVVIVSFIQLRGRRRVWLWLVIPIFAILYAFLGVLLARIFVSARAEVQIGQIELQHEGWPEAYLVTYAWQAKMDGSSATYRFPADSQLSAGGAYDNLQQSQATFDFRQSASGSDYTCAPGPSRHGDARVRSWITPQAPVDLSVDGKVTARRDFSAAWMWDGSQWREPGTLHAGQSFMLASQSISEPLTNYESPGNGDPKKVRVPASLNVLLGEKNTAALTAAGERLFIGVQDIADCQLDDASSYKIESRRTVVYQFTLPKGLQ